MEKYAVIGNPINHSLSPAMQEAAFVSAGREASYEALQLSAVNFDKEFQDLLATDFNGFNVTVPFKERVIPFLDELSPFAKRAGAVNTIAKVNNKWYGDNTDGAGFVEGLEAIRKVRKQDRILIIGAGGASKAIYLALADLNPKTVVIANRTISKAKAMILPGHEVMTLKEAEQKLADFSIIVQTTSIGLPKTRSESPISLHHLASETIVIDIIYNPAETTFLKEAKTRGAIIQNGLPMFISQGALSYEKWTKQKPNRQVMRAKVLEKLGGISSI